MVGDRTSRLELSAAIHAPNIDDVAAIGSLSSANVDFYSATVYHAMGIPHDLFTPVFAMSRVAGWCAHVMEQYANNRIYRPRGRYVGPTGLRYEPIDRRKS